MKRKDVFDRAYGNIPVEVGFAADIDINIFRGLKYYYLKLIRFLR